MRKRAKKNRTAALTAHKRADRLDERLSRLRLFAGLADSTVSEIVERTVIGEVRRYAKGEVIVHEGTEAKWLVPILSGVVSVYEPGACGERHLVRTVKAGQLFGATLVTSRMEYYPGMAVAGIDCEVVFLAMAKIRELWHDEKYRKFFENLYTIVSEYVLYCWRKMSIMSCQKAEDRFMLYLNWYASEVGEDEVIIPFARMEDCACYLGVTRVSLSRAIAHLVKRGEIAHSAKGRFALLDKDDSAEAKKDFHILYQLIHT